MKKLANDPSRNVNAVSGMWVRLRKDGSKYDVRYVNAKVKRVWSLSQTSQGTAWNVQAKGVRYEDFLNGMRSSQTDFGAWLDAHTRFRTHENGAGAGAYRHGR